MNTETLEKPAAAQVAVPVAKVTATSLQIVAYCAAIEAGQSVAEIFPAKIRDMEPFTKEQKEQIKTARRNRKDWCRKNKAEFLKMVRPKHVELTRAVDRPTSLGLGFVKTIEVAKRKAARKAKGKVAKATA